LQSIYEEEILELIASGWDGMTQDQKGHWETIKVAPEKWMQKQSLPVEHSGEAKGIDRNEFEDVDMEGGDFDDGDGGFDEYSAEASGSDAGFDASFEGNVSDEHDEDSGEEVDEGFWAVATMGDQVLWYNHVEQGFNVSLFSSYGCIDNYESRKDSFDAALKKMMPV
jgi:hypothetical protein